jgi:Protein of unknown function (DUF2868)
VLWNLLVYATLLLHTLGLAWPGAAPVRKLLQPLFQRRAPSLKGSANAKTLLNFQRHWLQASAAPNTASAAALLHAAAAALALGMVLSLYLRGLVLDYRAGWQSTFLDAGQVQAALNLLLAPASHISGVGVPAVAGLQVLPDVAAVGPAAPWLHLYATTLAVAVVVPRLLLAAAAHWRARRLAAAIELPWHEPYFERLLLAATAVRVRVQVWPHGAGWAEPAVDTLKTVLRQHFDAELDVQLEPPTAYGDEEPRGPGKVVAGGAQQLALFDLGATPEAETQGRFIEALKRAGAVTVLTDEASFQRRFASYPERLAQRRAAWRHFCSEQRVNWLSADLSRAEAGR